MSKLKAFVVSIPAHLRNNHPSRTYLFGFVDVLFKVVQWSAFVAFVAHIGNQINSHQLIAVSECLRLAIYLALGSIITSFLMSFLNAVPNVSYYLITIIALTAFAGMVISSFYITNYVSTLIEEILKFYPITVNSHS